MAVPAAAPVAAGVSGQTGDAEVIQQRRAARRKAYRNAALWIVAYYGFGVAYYCTRADKLVRVGPLPPSPPLEPCAPADSGITCLEQWNAVDALYFATVTMTTTGYGDLKPLTVENRFVTMVYLLFGMLFAFPAVATALAPLYMRLEYSLYQASERCMRRLGFMSDGTQIDLDGDGLADFEEPPNAAIYYLKGVSAWLTIWGTSQLLFAVGYTVRARSIPRHLRHMHMLCQLKLHARMFVRGCSDSTGPAWV